MRMQVSAIALAAALLAAPQSAQAQLLGVDVNSNGGGGLGVDVNVGGSDGVSVGAGLGGNDSGSGVDAGVSIGGSSGVNVDAGVGTQSGGGVGVDAGVGVGGSDGVSVDAGLGVGGSSGVDLDAGVNVGGDSGLGVDASAGVGTRSGGSGGAATGPNGGTLIDLDTAVSVGGNTTASNPPRAPQTASAPASVPLIGTGVSLSALGGAARLEAIAELLNGSDIGDIDLDAVVDDRNVSVILVSDLLGMEGPDEIAELFEDNPEGRQDILDAVAGSSILSSVLGNQGIDLDDVVAIQVRDDGATEVLVLDDAVQVAIGGTASDAPLAGEQSGGNGLLDLSPTELAELDVALLSDEDVTRIDLSVLPREDQRLAAVLRLLETEEGDGENDGSLPDGGALRIVDISAFLDDASLAQVDAVAGSEDGDLVLTADLLRQLDPLGLSPEAVVAVRALGNDEVAILVNTGAGAAAGDDSIAEARLIDVGLNVGGGAGSDSDGGNGGNGSGAGDGTGGADDGNDGSGGAPDNGSDGTGSGGSGGSGSGNEPGAGDDGDNDAAGDNGAGGSDGALADNGAGINSASGGMSAPAVDRSETPKLFAQLGCDAGIAALNKGDDASPTQIAQAQSLELVQVIGCAGELAPADIERLRASIEANDQLAKALVSVGVEVEEVVGATAGDGIVTVFVAPAVG